MKTLLIVIVGLAVSSTAFAGFTLWPGKSAVRKVALVTSQDEAFKLGKTTVIGRSVNKGIIIEKSDGVPPYWLVAGYTHDSVGKLVIMIKQPGSDVLRPIPAEEFIIIPSSNARFKLAQIDGKGKFLPVDLVNVGDRVDGKLAWVLVTED